MDISTPEALSAAIEKLTQELTENNAEVARLEGNYRKASTGVKNAQDGLTLASNAADTAQKSYDKLNAEFESTKAQKTTSAF
jgi:predicted  nucleic acid-binding Zn-ribbon protein